MASVNSLSGSSSSSSIYGNRTYNIISGLASGLDTEELISGVVQSYQQKIQNLQKENTTLQWKQESYQSISDKLVEFERNYASYLYSSGTNLSSSSFFNSAILTTAKGNYADLVSASGKSSSNIVLNAVKQLATAATYTANSKKFTAIDGNTLTGGAALDLSKEVETSNLEGSLTITYGNKEISIDFDKKEFFRADDGSFDAAALEKAINDKLKEQNVSIGSGSYTADEAIGVSVSEDGKITFSDKRNAGNSVYISDASGALGKMLKLDEDKPENNTSIQLDTAKLVEKTNAKDYLKGKSFTVTLDGVSKTIALPEVTDPADPQAFVAGIQDALDKAFGEDKITAGLDIGGKMTFTRADAGASNLSVEASDSAVGDVLGIGSGMANYLDTDRTLEALGVDFKGLKANEDGLYELKINDVSIGFYGKDTKLSEVLDDINGNTKAGVKVSYSKLTNEITFTAKDTGEGGRIDILADSLGARMFGNTIKRGSDERIDSARYTEGQDSVFSVTVNGKDMELSRSTNTVDLDGMKVTFNDTFNEDKKVGEIASGDKITFTTTSDSDTIVDAVKKMITDFNSMMSEIKKAYSTTPLQNSSGERYEPLSDDDMADMSDSAIEKYEEKAKTGLLFMDRDLSSLYNDLRSAVTSLGSDLRSIGIDTAYSNGETTLTLDENALREALQSDPDRVQEVFTRSRENGASTDGLMAKLQSVTQKYAATTGATKGILIEKAGSKYAPTAALNNDMLSQMQEVEEEISKWQDKMSSQVDYYTNKFTQLEMLINQMNSQSSALSGLLGG